MKLPVQSQATYSGTSQSSVFAKQDALCQASQNCAKITSFFPEEAANLMRDSNAPPPDFQPDMVEIEWDEDLEQEQLDIICQAVPQPEDSEERDDPPSAENETNRCEEMEESDVTSIGDLREEMAHEWLNPMTDEEDGFNETPIAEILKKIILKAKKFKAYAPLMHLHAVKRFIELCEVYKINPKINASTCQVSIVVARSIGKGKYFA